MLDGAGRHRRRRRATRARAATVQMVFQDPQSALNPRRRVASIVTQALEAGSRHASWHERLARARELLGRGRPAAGVRRHGYPAQLSGGQRQRVNIARALCARAASCWSPTRSSPVSTSRCRRSCSNLLPRLRAELGFAMLFISHDLSVVRYLCDRVLVMYRGEIVEQGAVEKVFADPQHAYTRALLSSVPPDDPGGVAVVGGKPELGAK